MNFAIALLALLLIGNAFAFVSNVFHTYRLRREWRRVHALDILLTRIAWQSFHDHRLPLIGAAWSAVMGSIEVEIKQTRVPPEN